MSTVAKGDRREIGKMLRFMRLVREGMPQFQAYGEVYGETVFEDKSTLESKPHEE